jgi:flagellar motor switch protein FliM
MSEHFLSQDEVDALLEGVTGDLPKDEADAAPASGVRDYRLESQERIVRGRMPTMEIVNERFARNFRTALAEFIRRTAQVTVGPVRVVKYSAFLRDIVAPTSINVIAATPLRGQALVVFDPKLVFAVIDALFGSGLRLHGRIEGRDFSPTETRIIERLLDLTLAEYQRAWMPSFRFGFQHQRSELHPQFANVATPSESVVTTSFNIDLAGAGGELHLCFPYSTLEPIRDILYSTVQGDRPQPDARWLGQLTQQVQAAEVELAAELATTRLTVRELRQLRVGDFVELPLKEIIPVTVDGVPVMECRFGTVNGRTAVRIERMLKYSQFADRRKPGEPAH